MTTTTTTTTFTPEPRDEDGNELGSSAYFWNALFEALSTAAPGELATLQAALQAREARFHGSAFRGSTRNRVAAQLAEAIDEATEMHRVLGLGAAS